MAVMLREGPVRRRAARPPAPGIHDMLALPWTEAGKPGIYHKIAYGDADSGRFLGLIRFDPLVRSGLHQHLGVATSYFLAGSLSDYGGSASRGQAGINLCGDTHDAVSYEGCVLAARLEAPVIYAEHEGERHQLHLGARQARLRPIEAGRRPDINIAVDALPEVPTALAGVSRAMVFDYAAAGADRRFVSLRLQPGAALPAHRASARVDWFVVAGDLQVAQAGPARAGCFVTAAPGTALAARSRGGCHLLAWAEGPAPWQRGARPDLYGFPSAGSAAAASS